MPLISVILPVFNGKPGLRRAIDSIRAQSIPDWELLIINELGSEDGSAQIARDCGEMDTRIRLIQNTQRMGLAESINLGITQAGGQFIARIDADDVALPLRFQKQLALFDAQSEVGVCGTWQRHIEPQRKWVHHPPADSEQLRVAMLFTCELCHSTVMMRRSVVVEHGLWYDPHVQAEDYELWTRALAVTKLANVPEVLGEYYYGNNITQHKLHRLETEHGALSAAAIRRTLMVDLPQEEHYLLNAWTNIFRQQSEPLQRREMLLRYQDILRRIWYANQSVGAFSPTALLNTLRARWLWANWDLRDVKPEAGTLDQVFAPVPFPKVKWAIQALQRNPGPVQLIEKLRNRVGRA